MTVWGNIQDVQWRSNMYQDLFYVSTSVIQLPIPIWVETSDCTTLIWIWPWSRILGRGRMSSNSLGSCKGRKVTSLGRHCQVLLWRRLGIRAWGRLREKRIQVSLTCTRPSDLNYENEEDKKEDYQLTSSAPSHSSTLLIPTTTIGFHRDKIYNININITGVHTPWPIGLS